MADVGGPASGPTSEKKVFSLEDLDEIIESEDPNFKNEMTSIKDTGGNIRADIETLPEDGEEQAESDAPEESTELSPKEKFRAFILSPWRRLKDIHQLKKISFKNRILVLIESTKVFVRHELPDLLKYYKSRIIAATKWLISFLSHEWGRFTRLTTMQKISLGFVLLAPIAAVMVLSRVYLGGWLPKFSDPLVHAFNERAEFIGSYKDKSELQDLFEAFPEVEFTVLLTKVIVNLKPDENSGANPMGAFEMYIGVDSQDTAIEVKDREKEMLDIIQRALEHFSYSEVVTQVGKARMKALVRDRINEVLNQGRVFHIYFNTFLVNP